MTPRAISIGEPQIRPVMCGMCSVLRRLPSPLIAALAAGDRLWVREPFCLPVRFGNLSPTSAERQGARPLFRFGELPPHDRISWTGPDLPGAPRPNYTLPRRWHRQHLRVIEVRREHLRAIPDADIRAEGFADRGAYAHAWERGLLVSDGTRLARHGPRSWEADPEVLVIRFQRIAEPVPAEDLAPAKPGPKERARIGSVRLLASIRSARVVEGRAAEPAAPSPLLATTAPGAQRPVPMQADDRLWCDQCERRVTPEEGRACNSRFCRVHPELAA